LKKKASLAELKNEIALIRKRYPTFKDDAAFVFWFLHAYLVDKEEIAKSALTGKEGGRTGEKNVDAIYIDEQARQCNIIQGKYRQTETVSEKRNDVLAFAELGLLPWADKATLETFYRKLDPIVLSKLRDVVSCVKSKKYKLNLFYITTGKCTTTVIDDAKSTLRDAEGEVDLAIISFDHLMTIYQNYLEGIAPAVPLLKLRIVSDGAIQHEGIIHRFDPRTKIESWVFSMSGKDVGSMFSKTGIRLFAKNIRGYLGITDINDSMIDTIKKEPSNFWYYNNGVTLVCDNARREVEANEDVLIVDGAQIINGQQTTRTLEKNGSDDTNVLVKVIKIPRNMDGDSHYDKLVNSIVRSTNWQNHIEPSDLVSNDYIQVFLERELRKRNYQYIRKRMSKSEARSIFGQGYWQIDKRELAQAVAACLFDPVVVRKGREGLFEDPYYKSIFGSSQISFYLSKFWLMKQVQSISYGYPERAYAKWLVLNYSWSVLKTQIESGAKEKKFRIACEQRDWKVLIPLHKYLEQLFKLALKMYKQERGSGEEAKDISSFFQLTKLDQSFIKFYSSSKNDRKSRLNSYHSKFARKLAAIEFE